MSYPAKPVRIVESKLAPNPRRVRIFMAEKGIHLPVDQIDIMQLQHKTDEHQSRAGVPVIPVLELSDGSWLSETVAICRYLEAAYPENNLMGADGYEGAQIEMWNRRVELGLFAQIAAVFRHLNPHMARLEDQVPEWGENNKSRLMKSLELLNSRLAETDYIAAGRFTIADITAWVALDFMKVTKISIPETHTHLIEWLERMRSREAATA